MIELGESILSVIVNLISSVIYDGIKDLPYFQRRKIERCVEDAVAEVVEPLLPFFDREGIPKEKQLRLIETCVQELQPLAAEPNRLFHGSLNGQKIFDSLYKNKDFPQTVIEDDLKGVYTLLCPRIATLFCKIPVAVKDWEKEAWSESFNRFDEISGQLRAVFQKVDEIATSAEQETDALLTVIRRTVAQKIRFELDLTGLRGDSPKAGKFDDFFIHPSIQEVKDNGESKISIGEMDESFTAFTARGDRFTIIGQPGAGKSTWAKWLQREALSARWIGLCVRIELRRSINESLPSLHELIRQEAGQHQAENLTAERIAAWINSSKVIFIFDGFDEIPPSNRDEIHSWITELEVAVQDCPVIVTSRPLTTDHLQRFHHHWQTWVIEPFNNERITKYIRQWYEYMPLLSEGSRNVDIQVLTRNWLQDPTIEPLTGNPLLLSTLLMVHHLDGSLPSGRSQLYRRYVEGMLGIWDDRREVAASDVRLTLENKRRILRGFALNMFMQQKEQLDESDALNLIEVLLQNLNISADAEDVLSNFRERSGLIVGPGIYSFIHKSVLEYLVAESVLQGDQTDNSGRRIDRFCLFENRDDDRWNTVVFLWAGLAPVADVELFINQCIDIRQLPLAYGVLADQYDKFQPETRKQFILKLVFMDQDLINYDREISWFFPYTYRYKGDGKRLLIPSFWLRGLSSDYDSYFSHRLIGRTVRERNIKWSDVAGGSGKARDVVWMHCAINIQDNEEWKQCILSTCPENKNSDMWMHWVTTRVLTIMVGGVDSSEVSQILETIESAYESFASHMPITLLSIMADMADVLAENKRLERENYEALEEVMNAYSKSDANIVPDELLLGTKEWGCRPGVEDKTRDLLGWCSDRMEELAKNAFFKESVPLRNTMALISKLRQKRDSLPQ